MIQDRSQLVMKKTLDALALRQQAIAHNIANVNTPGYKRAEVEFEEILAAKLEGGTNHDFQSEINGITPRIKVDTRGVTRNDKSNVDIEQEMAGLADTNLRYNTLIEFLRQKYSLLRYSINEGRR